MNITKRILNAYEHLTSLTQLPESHGLESNTSVLILWSTVGSGFSSELGETNKRTIENCRQSRHKFVADIISWFHGRHSFLLPWQKNPNLLRSQFCGRWILPGLSQAPSSHSSLRDAFPASSESKSAGQRDESQSPLEGRGNGSRKDFTPSSKWKWCKVIYVTSWHLFPLENQILFFFTFYWFYYCFILLSWLLFISLCVTCLSLSTRR